MAITLRKMLLPDGEEVLEIERQHYGGSETQVTYEYKYEFNGPTIPTDQYKKDYWGRIEGGIEIND